MPPHNDLLVQAVGYAGAHPVRRRAIVPRPSLLPHGFRSGGVKGTASSGPLSLKGKTKGRGEHGWWTETTNEQVGWGGPTSARPRPETELVRMWEDSLFGAMGPQRCEREGRWRKEEGLPSFLGSRGRDPHNSLQTKRQKERKRERHPKIGKTKGNQKPKKTSGSGSRSRDIFFRCAGPTKD